MVTTRPRMGLREGGKAPARFVGEKGVRMRTHHARCFSRRLAVRAARCARITATASGDLLSSSSLRCSASSALRDRARCSRNLTTVGHGARGAGQD